MSYAFAVYMWFLSMVGLPQQQCSVTQLAGSVQACEAGITPPATDPPADESGPRNVVWRPQISNGL